MITQVRGVVHAVDQEELVLGVGPFELAILIPEYARRQVQGKIGEMISLHTILDIEGGQMSGKMAPRLIGFLTTIDREFFEILCSVDGMGVRKSLRAMVRPVREVARLIQDRDLKMLATFPGIGEAMAERIVAKIRRKVGKFTLIVGSPGELTTEATGNGQSTNAEPDVIQDTYASLLSVGHTESQARELIDRVLSSGKRKYRSVADMIEAIYRFDNPEEEAQDAS